MGRFQADWVSEPSCWRDLPCTYIYVCIYLTGELPSCPDREGSSMRTLVLSLFMCMLWISVRGLCSACWEYIFGLVTARTQGHGAAVALLLSGCWIQHDIFSSDKLVSMCCNFKAPGRIPAWQTDITSVCTLRYSVFSSVIKCLVWELQISTRFFLCSPPVRCVRTHITNHLMWGGAHRVTDTKNLLKTDLLPVNLSWRWMINNSKIRQNCYLVVLVL